MPASLIRGFSSAVAIALSCALTIAPLVATVHAAPEPSLAPAKARPPKSLKDIRIHIPFQPDVLANGCHARPTPAQELADTTQVPFWYLIRHAVGRHAGVLTVDGRERFEAELATIDDDMRDLVLLYALWDGLGRDGLHTFFYLDSGVVALSVRDALKRAGLKRELEIFSQAIALFGENFPVVSKDRESYFGWSKPATRIDDTTSIPAPLNAFDHKMLALSEQFGNKDAFSNVIVGYVEHKPALWQRIEALREKLNEPDRLRVLTHALWMKVDNLWRSGAKLDRALSALTPEQRTLFVIDAFKGEFENGGVHQFFYNSEGSLAPDVHEAMIELGLTRQAAILKKGLDMFGPSYVRDTERRREIYFAGEDWNEWDKRLSALTDEFYALDGGREFQAIGGGVTVEGGPGLDDAMLKYARRYHMLPC
jgi:hypothetical protein